MGSRGKHCKYSAHLLSAARDRREKVAAEKKSQGREIEGEIRHSLGTAIGPLDTLQRTGAFYCTSCIIPHTHANNQSGSYCTAFFILASSSAQQS